MNSISADALSHIVGRYLPSVPLLNTAGKRCHTDEFVGKPSLLLLYGGAEVPGASQAFDALAAFIECESLADYPVRLIGCDIQGSKTPDALLLNPLVQSFTDPGAQCLKALGLEIRRSGTTLWFTPGWVLVDPTLRVIGAWPIEYRAEALSAFRKLSSEPDAVENSARPALIVRGVFGPEFCQQLIAHVEATGQLSPTNFLISYMNEMDMRSTMVDAFRRRLTPSIKRAFGYAPRLLERRLIAKASADSDVKRSAGRDAGIPARQYRKLSVAVALSDTSEGQGGVTLPEFGAEPYRLARGDALVHSSELLRAFSPVHSVPAHYFLPVLHDREPAEKIISDPKFEIFLTPNEPSTAYRWAS